MKQLVAGTFSRLKKTKILSNFVNLSSIQVSNAVLVLLLYPVITRIVGLEAFGQIMVANAFAGLMGILVNYGTIQTSIKEVAVFKEQKKSLSSIVANTFAIRLAFFTVVAILLSFSGFFMGEYYLFYLLTLPLIFAEVLNPMFIFLGVQNLKIFNLANLVAKAATVLVIILFVQGSEDAMWVNFLMGSVLSLGYLFLIIRAAKMYGLHFQWPSRLSQMLILKSNFYLFFNNIAVHLQQSLMLFALQRWGTPELLGAYSLGDKVVWSGRMLLISISSAVYPTSARLFNNDPRDWIVFKRKVKLSVGILFLLGSFFLFLFPELIIGILIGEPNSIAVLFLRQMALVPFIAALNLMNVLDRLLYNDNLSIFKIALLVFVVSAGTSYFLVNSGMHLFYGYYPLVIEVCAFILYELQIKRKVGPAISAQNL